jgi:hypothetical protein
MCSFLFAENIIVNVENLEESMKKLTDTSEVAKS